MLEFIILYKSSPLAMLNLCKALGDFVTLCLLVIFSFYSTLRGIDTWYRCNFIFSFYVVQEKLRESLRAYIQAAPWIPQTPAKFSNTGIVVGLKIPLILDALQHLILHMMINDATVRPRNRRYMVIIYYSSFSLSVMEITWPNSQKNPNICEILLFLSILLKLSI